MRPIAGVALVFLFAADLGAGTEPTTRVELNAPVTISLAAGGSNSHWIDLETGHFVYAEADQHDLDVKITVYDGSDEVVGVFDAPARGAEAILLETESDGRYRIDVAAVEDDAPGSYTLTLLRLEPLATDPEKRVDQLLSPFSGDDVPGAVVAVIRDGEVVHSQAVGMANLTFGIPFTRQTVSNIGSVSKQFTAFAVTRLAKSGVLSLDDDVREYFPELPDLGQTVTVRDLLRHTSGYREFLNLLAMSGRRLERGDYIDRDEVLDILQGQTALQDAPGSLFNYNNTAYALAALLVERVAGVPFPEWLEDNLFAPLGMRHTRLRSSTGEIIPNAADGYLYGEEVPFRQAVDLGGGGGAVLGPGGIYTTVDDLALWIGNLHSGSVGGREVIEEMTTPQIDAPGEDSHYGLGLALERHRGLDLIEHGGADTAHRAQLLFYPEINAAVVTMSNHGGFSSSLARKTAEAFFADEMVPEAMVSEEASADEAEASTDVEESAILDPSTFEPFVGKYEFEDYPGVVLDVSLIGDRVMIQSPGDDPRPVSPTSPTTLRVTPTSSIEFHPNASGGADSLTWHSTEDLVAHHLEAWTPRAEDLAEYQGRYFSEELSTFYSVEMVDDGLVITHRRLDDIELIPKVEDSFNCSDVLTEVAFRRDEEGALTGLMASNVRTRDVWFERVD